SAYARVATGAAPPLRVLQGPATGLDDVASVAVDTIHDELIAASRRGDSVSVHPRTARGDVPPLRTLAGPDTGLAGPQRVLLDTVHDELVVGGAVTVTVYPRSADGNAPPLRTEGVAGFTGLLGVDFTTDPPLAASVLPASRSVQVGTPAT